MMQPAHKKPSVPAYTLEKRRKRTFCDRTESKDPTLAIKPVGREELLLEIGRASCRERVS